MQIFSRLFLLIHGGPEQQRIRTEVLGHSLIRSLVCSHRSLVCLLLTTCFVSALRCAHLLARSLTHFGHSRARGTVNDEYFFCVFL